MQNSSLPILEFHISRLARDRYQFDQSMFGLSGNVVFSNFYAARQFTQKMNQKRDLVNFPEQVVRAGQIIAMGLIDEILHYVVGLYSKQVNPLVSQQALKWLDEKVGRQSVDQTLVLFADQFPPSAVYRREISLQEYLAGTTAGIPNRQLLLEELVLLWLTNRNPATSPYSELFDDSNLTRDSAYLSILNSLHAFFDFQPPFGPDGQNLIDMLRSPAVAIPHSLSGQLEYIRERWGSLLGSYLYRLLGSLDLIREEEKAIFLGPGPIGIPTARDFSADGEKERYSPDQEWMPRVVLIAKNAYVWLDQLSKKYRQPFYRLDQIPDEELDILARWGISGLWLIGLWERSPASARVKQILGNPEAVASAYSLVDYAIANDLGGYLSYTNLRDRAWQHGIRLASDMVPNHMGIDSTWLMEHPDRFLALDYSPFPSYSFNGPDLSPDPSVGVFIEDHYYNRSDAAVVFKRLDRRTGSEKYVYHGNDGTSMPWNDTAQLNYLNPEVREAVIQTILHVARQFPIIRFDAAMTLAKKHYQRLWFPEPGTGGAIPTRSEHGLTKEQFDEKMPVEFWREVVDRVAQEVPNTLLLAEAFWLMEGYFVRTLGMHRVYNSAFMILLRDEENAKYRLILKNTLEFDPQILKRFVNFMNNPDERTAVDQFGKGDKYFGICTLMATMPGLPMFGHGQIQGFTEKYGMEYRRAYWEEVEDSYLVQRHEREIFPLLHRRSVFAEVDDFLLYDFFNPEGLVDENVFAYSNRSSAGRGLVVYHNRYAATRGWIRTSAAYSVKDGSGDTRKLLQRSLGEGLDLTCDENRFCIFRDYSSGLEYIRSSKELCEQGLYLELNAYKVHTFLDIREVVDDPHQMYRRLTVYLSGRGVPNIQEALHELFLQPVLAPFGEIVDAGMVRWMVEKASETAGDAEARPYQPVVEEVEQKTIRLFDSVKQMVGGSLDERMLALQIRRELEAVFQIPVMETELTLPGSKTYARAVQYLQSGAKAESSHWLVIIGWLAAHRLGQMMDPDAFSGISRSWIDEWLLGRQILSTAAQLELGDEESRRLVSTVKAITAHQRWFDSLESQPISALVETWLADADIQQLIGINRYKDILWFNKEAFEDFLWWLMLVGVLDVFADLQHSSSQVIERMISLYEAVEILREAEAASDYQISKLLDHLKQAAPAL